jgi:trehalose-phosphatase
VDLSGWLRNIARNGARVLVASDFDGTLSEIVSRPDRAELRGDARGALLRLAQCGASIAVISGRTLADLRRLLDGIPGLWLAGERGAEIDRPDGRPFRVAQVPPAVSHGLLADWRRLAEAEPGVTVEAKPHGGTLHDRNAPALRHPSIRRAAEALCGLHGARSLEARLAVEADYLTTDKRRALEMIHREEGVALPVVYAGDDRVDESALEYAYAAPASLALHVRSAERPRPGCRVHGQLDGPREWVRVLHQISDAMERGRSRSAHA